MHPAALGTASLADINTPDGPPSSDQILDGFDKILHTPGIITAIALVILVLGAKWLWENHPKTMLILIGIAIITGYVQISK